MTWPLARGTARLPGVACSVASSVRVERIHLPITDWTQATMSLASCQVYYRLRRDCELTRAALRCTGGARSCVSAELYHLGCVMRTLSVTTSVRAADSTSYASCILQSSAPGTPRVRQLRHGLRSMPQKPLLSVCCNNVTGQVSTLHSGRHVIQAKPHGTFLVHMRHHLVRAHASRSVATSLTHAQHACNETCNDQLVTACYTWKPSVGNIVDGAVARTPTHTTQLVCTHSSRGCALVQSSAWDQPWWSHAQPLSCPRALCSAQAAGPLQGWSSSRLL